MRQVTRELHEAAQGARDAAKELRAAHAEIPVMVDNILGPYAEKELDGIAEQIRAVEARVVGLLSDLENQVFDRMAEIATSGSSREQWLEDIGSMVDRAVTNPDYLARVARYVIGRMPVQVKHGVQG